MFKYMLIVYFFGVGGGVSNTYNPGVEFQGFYTLDDCNRVAKTLTDVADEWKAGDEEITTWMKTRCVELDEHVQSFTSSAIDDKPAEKPKTVVVMPQKKHKRWDQ